MKRLLIAGLYVPDTGLTNVLTALVGELRGAFSVRCLGLAPSDRDGEDDRTIMGCEARVRNIRARAFSADGRWLEREFTEHRPDAVLVIGPPILAAPLLKQLQPWRGATRIVLYPPIEGSLANDDFAHIMEMADTCVTYTEATRAEVVALFERRGREREPRLAVVGHGVDPSTFYPLPAPDERTRRNAARRALYQENLDDAFLVLNSNRPYLRKRLDLTISGFGLFARDKPDAHLHLHTGVRSVQQDAELGEAIARTGVAGRIHLTPRDRGEPPRPADWLNTLYNACDAGLTTAMGEGWGLGLFEHAATRAALIVPAHTGFVENWRGASLMVPAPGREFIDYEAANMAVVSRDDVARALDRLYHDRALLARLASAAFARAREARYTWGHVGAQFARILAA
ncbi:MAG TPA: hypothetical protein VF006_08265 [Longimicrobium sp.]